MVLAGCGPHDGYSRNPGHVWCWHGLLIVHHQYRAADHLNDARGLVPAAACSGSGSIHQSRVAAAAALLLCVHAGPTTELCSLCWWTVAALSCTCRHAQCVEVLVCNGASPLVLDNARHNSALHWAASCCRADCVGRLLGSGAIFQMQSGQLVAIAGAPWGCIILSHQHCAKDDDWICVGASM